jgi:hypothetical protein
MNMQRYLMWSIVVLMTGALLVIDLPAQQRLGSLERDSEIYTADDHLITKDGFPVFEIRVPPGYLEIQVRASITNFEPGFLLKDENTDLGGGNNYVLNYIPTDEVIAGRKVYRALGTNYEARWSIENAQWEIDSNNYTLTSENDAIYPWEIPAMEININLQVDPNQNENEPSVGGVPPEPGTVSFVKELFVYRFCTTGEPADAEWGQGSGDPDAFVYIANQAAVPGDNTEFKRVKWNSSSALADQLQPGGTPGYTVLFQPSRDMLGTDEWMQQNAEKLIWIYQVEDVSGKPKHPNGSDVWNVMYPSEWRKSRLLIE